MANVQIDSGEFTRIANILLEKAAQLHLNGTQYSIILTVWRFTYGFQRKEHDLSITFIANATGISTRAVKKELKVLIDKNVILVAKESTKTDSRVLKFNKDYETWKQGNNQSPATQGSKSSPGEQLIPSQGNKEVKRQGNNQSPKKDIVRKENSKDTLDNFFEMIWQLYPKKEGRGAVKKTQKEKLFKIGLEEMTRAVSRYIKAKAGEDRKYLKMGSTFFNSGYVDYLDANYQVEKPTEESGPTKLW